MDGGQWSPVEATVAGARPLQVVCLDMKENKVTVNENNLKLLCDILQSTGAEAVCIVAIMGTYRTGKSFLLSLLMRYLRYWEKSIARAAERAELQKTARKKAEWAAKMTEGKTDEEAAAAGEQAAADIVKELPELPFPLQRNEDWKYRGPASPLPVWLEAGANGLTKEAKVLGQEAFEWKNGMNKCTEGIWLWSRPFVLPYKGRKIAVLLMDTQGAWDGQMTKEQNSTIFGLTSLLASKLIMNDQNMLSDNKIDAIDFFTTFAQNACSGLRCDGSAFGHLEFLLRDWSHYKKGFSYDDCKGMMQEHLGNLLNNTVEGRKETAARLKEIFTSLSCSGLPHPGLHVAEDDFTGQFEDISNDFFLLLDEFARNFFATATFPAPSAPLGIEVTPSTFENVLRNFIQAFGDNTGSALDLREAFVKVEVFKTRDLLLAQFKQKLAVVAPEKSVVDPDVFAENEPKLKADVFRDFEAKIKPFKLTDEDTVIASFKEAVAEQLERRRKQNLAELESAQTKLFVYTPLAGGGLYFGGGFITGHPMLDTVVLGGLAYMQMQKHAARMDSPSVVHPEVFMGLAHDVSSFGEKRYRDAQAMYIASQKCTPGLFAERARDMATASAVRAIAAAGNSNNQYSNNQYSNNQHANNQNFHNQNRPA